jgi:hypothetical protein
MAHLAGSRLLLLAGRALLSLLLSRLGLGCGSLLGLLGLLGLLRLLVP